MVMMRFVKGLMRNSAFCYQRGEMTAEVYAASMWRSDAAPVSSAPLLPYMC